MNNSIIQKLDTIIAELLTNHSTKPLTFREAHNYLSVSSSYLYKLTSTGMIRHYKPSGKLIFFEKKDLDSWLKKNPVQSSDEIDQEVATRLIINSNNKSKGV
jgi:excisionase family DNA binding protein